jgi:dihydropteroate synthase
MGILNVTPDSFHDGDAEADLDVWVKRSRQMLDEGADLLDIGGESTRPGAASVSPEEEIRRTQPLIRELRRQGVLVPLSIDTSKAVVAEAALEAGADLVNDVTGGAGDPGMFALVARHHVPFVLMHMRGTPQTMKSLAHYGPSPVEEILGELQERLKAARSAGIDPQKILLDPGIGFAKDWRVSFECLRRLESFRNLGYPVLVAASRKSLLLKGAGTGPDSARRLPGSLVLAVHAAHMGACMVRVHDVSETVQALRTWWALEDGLQAHDWEQSLFPPPDSSPRKDPA